MKIRFLEKIEIQYAVGLDKNMKPVLDTEVVEKGEEFEMDVYNFGATEPGGHFPDKNYVQLVDVAEHITEYIPTSSFEILEGQDEFDQAFAEALEESKEKA
jgi:hypothetical protein